MAEFRSDGDYLGNQMGWAVRKMLPPTPQLRKLDRLFMRSLPRPVARIVALARFNLGLLPETDHPERLFIEMSENLGRYYIDTYRKSGGFNTLLMPSIGGELRVHNSEYKEGDREIPIRWVKQVEWANQIKARAHPVTNVLIDDLMEADTILSLQREIASVFELSKKDFIKRGLPLPELPTITLPPQK